MATIAGVGEWIAKGVHSTKWSSLTSGDVAAAQANSYLPNKSIFVTGTLGTSTVLIQGSNATSAAGSYFTLTDSAGNSLSFTASGADEVVQNTRWIVTGKQKWIC